MTEMDVEWIKRIQKHMLRSAFDQFSEFDGYRTDVVIKSMMVACVEAVDEKLAEIDARLARLP